MKPGDSPWRQMANEMAEVLRSYQFGEDLADGAAEGYNNEDVIEVLSRFDAMSEAESQIVLSDNLAAVIPQIGAPVSWSLPDGRAGWCTVSRVSDDGTIFLAPAP